MTTTPVLTRDIGRAERTLRALLDRLLDDAGISFPQWTVFNLLDGSASLSRSELVRRLVDGHVAPEPEARAAVDGLLSAGLVKEVEAADADDPVLTLTPAGEAVFRRIRQAVAGITDDVFGGLPPADVEATRRTLEEVARRAKARLAAG